MDPVIDVSRSVKGKIVLVTGAASGMGRATAHVFAREGARVAVTDVKADGANLSGVEIRGSLEGSSLRGADLRAPSSALD